MMEENSKKVYIVVSEGRTLVSSFIRFAIKNRYTHASISLYDDLHAMYSFARKYTFFPFWSGLISESPQHGILKKFPDTNCIILEATASAEDFDAMVKRLEYMLENRKKYSYNYIGAVLSKFNLSKKYRNKYYCSEFVKELLEIGKVNGVKKLAAAAKPESFLEVSEFKCIYRGNLTDYINKKRLLVNT